MVSLRMRNISPPFLLNTPYIISGGYPTYFPGYLYTPPTPFLSPFPVISGPSLGGFHGSHGFHGGSHGYHGGGFHGGYPGYHGGGFHGGYPGYHGGGFHGGFSGYHGGGHHGR